MPRRKRTPHFFITNNIRNVARKSKEIADKIIHGRNDLSPNVKYVLRQMGEATITGMTIGRSIINGRYKCSLQRPV